MYLYIYVMTRTSGCIPIVCVCVCVLHVCRRVRARFSGSWDALCEAAEKVAMHDEQADEQKECFCDSVSVWACMLMHVNMRICMCIYVFACMI